MFKTVFVSSILLCCFLFPVHAGVQVYDKTLKTVALGWGGEGVYVATNEATAPEGGCSTSTFVMTPDTPLFQENYAMLLAAFHANSKVNLYVDGCAGQNMKLKAVSVNR